MEQNQSVYMIESGIVNMRYYTKEGNVVTVLQKVPGDLYGIKGLFHFKGEKNFYSVAATDVRCWKISRLDFLNLLETNSEFTICAFQWFTTYMDTIERKMLNSAFLNTYQRLILTLTDFAEMTGNNKGTVHLTQQEIANILATSRQTVSAYLTLLEDSGLIQIKRGQILLNDMDALKEELV